ncbi:MAG: DUF475 domain-containing protein [Myxococcales bacterium]|nr:DUF475 domain-containing protein [Myxococcales bacterium]
MFAALPVSSLLSKYFSGSIAFTVLALAIAAWVGWESGGTGGAVLHTLFIVVVLGVLEVSLSFDNAVVNATVLRDMDAVWRRRFLTWGIAIAVFGMRVVFPLVIVAVIAQISPWAAVLMAATDPAQYARVLTSAHLTVSAFGGAFLAMVGLKHFVSHTRNEFWLSTIERPLNRLGKIEAVELALVMLVLLGVSRWLPSAGQLEFIVAGMFGLLCHIAVDGISALLEHSGDRTSGVVVRSGLGSFLYLEVLDASFSFDGVIGAFALSTNLIVIALGLGIGAMFVRSLTIWLVDEGTLTAYRYLEAGAFWAILALAVIMFLQPVVHIPEVVTGLIGAGFIGLAFANSVQYNRRPPGP